MWKNLAKPLFLDIKKFILNTLFPTVCVWCQKEGQFLCGQCMQKVKIIHSQQCIICRQPSPMGLIHAICQRPRSPDGLVSFYDYHNKIISKLIIDGKYLYVEEIFEFLGMLIAERIRKGPYAGIFCQLDEGSPRWHLTPVPLANSRLRYRGFNQAEVLCRTLSTELGIYVSDVLVRPKPTKTQKELSRSERLKNVKNAFALNCDKSLIKDQNFIVVDDVITTGATILEAAKVLKINGANKVWCLTIARD